MSETYPKPKFNIGDKATFQISGEIEGVVVKSQITATIVKIELASNDSERFLRYGLTDTPCGAYYAGKGVRWMRSEHELQPVETP